MPLKAGVDRRHTFEDRARAARLRQLHLHDADLGLGRRPDLAAERLREKLVAEAEAEEWRLPLDDRLPDRHALGLQPRVGVVLPDVHRTAHDPQRVVGAEVRDRLAFVELDRGPFDAVLMQEVPEHPRVLDRDVLEDQDPRVGCGHRWLPWRRCGGMLSGAGRSRNRRPDVRQGDFTLRNELRTRLGSMESGRRTSWKRPLHTRIPSLSASRSRVESNEIAPDVRLRSPPIARPGVASPPSPPPQDAGAREARNSRIGGQ